MVLKHFYQYYWPYLSISNVWSTTVTTPTGIREIPRLSCEFLCNDWWNATKHNARMISERHHPSIEDWFQPAWVGDHFLDQRCHLMVQEGLYHGSTALKHQNSRLPKCVNAQSGFPSTDDLPRSAELLKGVLTTTCTNEGKIQFIYLYLVHQTLSTVNSEITIDFLTKKRSRERNDTALLKRRFDTYK